ncbi:MAG: pilus assembly protein PilM, partial [Planctomycetales bacterium]|nr:pilus assembly protein PilM [Planctomycetales bacterium]
IQIAPLALYNFVCHDQLGQDPENPAALEEEEYTILLDMGTDNTTLLVTNGKKIWNRNVPMGGNHFTRALTKEMKLTFAKAEHLKCNATKAPDPKAVFQALRPVFNDYAAEVQRSIGYFSSVNRNARIKRIIGLGNGFKLAGLQKFLQQNLQLTVDRVETFPGLVGDAVLNAPLFQENIQSFAVAYGLGLQGLKLTRIHTSLLPPEIKIARLIRAKKPWAVAGAAVLLVGLTLSTVGFAKGYLTVREDRWKDGQANAANVVKKKGDFAAQYTEAVTANAAQRAEAESLLGMTAGNTLWLEILKTINECLPRDIGDAGEDKDITQQKRVRIRSIRATKMANPADWYKKLSPEMGRRSLRKYDQENAPAGGGYLFTLQCVHYHHDPGPDGKIVEQTSHFWAKKNFVETLQQWEFKHPGSNVTVPVRKLGITHAALTAFKETDIPYYGKLKNPRPTANALVGVAAGGAGPAAPMGRRPGAAGIEREAGERVAIGAGVPGAAAPVAVPMGASMIKQTEFTVEFLWQETPESERKATDPTLAPAEGAPADGATPAAAGAPATPAPTPTPTPTTAPPAATTPPPGAKSK